MLPGTDTDMSGCSFNAPYAFTGGGVILHVPQVNDVPVAYTTMTVRGNGSAFNMAMAYRAGSLRFGTLATDYAQLDGMPPPAWWRIGSNNGQIEAFTSTDGATWNSLAVAPITPPAAISVDIGTGLLSAPTVPGGNATFAMFAICN
jgi:hypothetical protein